MAFHDYTLMEEEMRLNNLIIEWKEKFFFSAEHYCPVMRAGDVPLFCALLTLPAASFNIGKITVERKKDVRKIGWKQILRFIFLTHKR